MGSTSLQEDLQRLNEQQAAIIKGFKSAALIVAGPGTGKTRTISVLIGDLLHRGVRLREILALTFSSKAALELKERVLEYYPHSYDECWISTFHSFCARILREQYYLVGIRPDFRLLTGFKEAVLMDMVCGKQQPEAFSMFGTVLRRRGFQQEVLTFISLLKSNLVGPDDFKAAFELCGALSERAKNRSTELLELFKLYEQARIEGGYLDFRDLIRLTIEVLKKPEVASVYRQRFKYILVDEFQDTDPAQYLLLTLLKGHDKDVKAAVIGDPHQSIYRFRGADPSMMADKGPFGRKYNARIFPLEINYRSSRAITNAANGIEWQSKDSRKSSLQNFSGQEGFVRFYRVKDELEEARLVCRRIAAMVICGDGERVYAPSEVAILVRNNYQIDLLTEHLKALRVPFTIAGDMKFFKSEEVIALASLFKLAGGVEREAALRRVFVSPIFGIDGLWAQGVLAGCDSEAALDEVFGRIGAGDFEGLPEADEAVRARAAGFVAALELVEGAAQAEVSVLLSQLLLVVGEALGQVASLAGRNVLHFRGMLAEYCEVFEGLRGRAALVQDLLGDFDEWLTYYGSTLEQETEALGDGVRIMTIHQSKGLEFPVVVMCGLSEGLFPVMQRENLLVSTAALEALRGEFNKGEREVSFFNPYPLDFEEHLEEERRLFFVGLTRAKEGIIMTSPQRVGGENTLVAPFLREIGVKAEEVVLEERPLSIAEFRTRLAKLSLEKLALLEADLQALEGRVTAEMSVHGLRPRAFRQGEHDAVSLPKNFSFSANSIRNYLDCPRKFFFKNVLRVDKPSLALSEIFARGNAFHACFEELHRPGSVWEQGKQPDDEDLAMLIKEFALPTIEGLGYFQRRELANQLMETLENYRRALYGLDQLPARGTEGVEVPFSFEFHKCRFTGRFDRLAVTDGGVYIVDYKSAAQGDNSGKMHERAFSKEGFMSEIQMPLYLLACEKLGHKRASMNLLYLRAEPFTDKNRSGVPGGYLRGASFNMGCGPIYGVNITAKDMDCFKARLAGVLDQILGDKLFLATPSTDKLAMSCRSGNARNRGCEFEGFCWGC